MSVSNMQNNLISAIDTIIDSKLSNTPSLQAMTGIVVSDPNGYKCIVKISNIEQECILPEHLHGWVFKDDVVIVQDLYGNGSELVVMGTTKS